MNPLNRTRIEEEKNSGRSATCCSPPQTPACSSPYPMLEKRHGKIKRLPFAEWQGSGREFLLTALGQAACLCKGVEVSLKTAAPRGVASYEQFSARVSDRSAPLLEQAGFGVMLPAW